ncbi:putative UDP-N-acetylglucosamine--peptide N-acetylglucosaminyltransferase SEC [Geobacter sp. OR-1]|uniref:tetratricopeptide repeat protein n=1 Tax=Geobacter sp. OR-1 TaxID=1266765 RepID=UPI000543B65E|nr:tetratricopeptide repeat protein [Geobacter sp. OR-1]GAM11704.1 putative UDP-N-acetylglucosamine--peptide N-acetylglucosaminyltransferase SEC [Geobacter sp. OR-1]
MGATFEECLAQGISLAEAGDNAGAVREFSRCTELEPTRSEGYCYLGESLAALGKSDEAISALKQSISLSPDVDALIALGDLYFEVGDHKQAIQQYKKVAEVDPKNADAYVNIGLVYSKMERIDEAIKAYEAALEIEPDNVFAYNAIGDAWYGQGEKEKAIAAFRKGIEVDPEDAAAHFNLGELYYDMEEFDEAEKECLEAVSLDPEFTLAYLTLGSLCMDRERVKDAIKYLELYLRYEKSPQAEEMVAEVKAVLEGLRAELP